MSLDTHNNFRFAVPVGFFEKADAPAGRRRRVGGPISVETWDKQDELVLQRGLDFSPFVESGYLNDNHEKGIDGIVGYPDGDSVQVYKGGETLPDGTEALASCTWTEGWILEGDPRADKIWSKAMALKKAGADRQLGFSIEGSVQKRTGRDRKTIAKAVVKNVAVTHCPVNPDTRLDVLAKSLSAIESNDEEFLRALTMGTPATPGTAPVGPVTGEGAGQILVGESLETGRKKKKKKKLSKSEAIAMVLERFPGATCETAGRIVDITLARFAHQTT